MPQMIIENIVHRAHLKWLSKAETVTIKGSEMTVLPYGYLEQAVRESLIEQMEENNKLTPFEEEALKEFDEKLFISGKNALGQWVPMLFPAKVEVRDFILSLLCKQREGIANFIKKELDHDRSDLKNGWSMAESGPCCDKCVMGDEHFDGRADAIKAKCGCRDPFQVNCSCHLLYRKTADRSIKAYVKNLMFYLETRPDLIRNH